ncbi:transient receptor potential cation channel protein painless-like [Bacillus rossius redtenbacheri]|uniref:transient receptor potential cation channel protein painless-like n=1 Tax=Bacillus rossius redtenbacheri TaxID=93214 RepID=UPI002FDD861F
MSEPRQLERCGSICAPDPYEELLAALTSKDLDKFRRLLDGADIADPDHAYGHRGSCLYVACSLDDGAPYVEALLRRGADPNLVNQQLRRAPVHVAAAKGNVAVLRALLAGGRLDVAQLDKFGDTALHAAAKQLKDDRGGHDECLELLLEETDADANLPNRQDLTAVHLVAQRACRRTLENVLRLAAPDLDSYRSPVDEKTARQIIAERYPDLPLPQLGPAELSEGRARTALFKHLRRRDARTFESALDDALGNHGDAVVKWHDGSFTLLQYACSYGLAEHVQVMLGRKFDPNYTIQTNPKAPIFLACKNGFYKILEKFINYLSMSDAKVISFYDFDGRTSILHAVINGKRWGTITSPDQDYDKCLDIIMNNILTLDIDIDSVDSVGNTALHYAAKHQLSDIITRLLANGAYIGTKDRFGELPLAKIELDILENFLNSCVKEGKNKDQSADDFEVELNYEMMVPPRVKALCKRRVTGSNTNSIADKSLARTPECLMKRRGSEYSVIINDVDKKPLNSPVTHEIIFKTSIQEKNKEYLKNSTPEIGPLLYIGRSKQLRHLLTHPVFSSFMYLKWQSFQYFFYINLFLYLLFVILLSIYILCDYANFPVEEGNENVLHNKTVHDAGVSNKTSVKSYIWGFLVVFEILLIAREMFQLLVSPKRYFRSPENYMELLLIVLTSIIIFSDIQSQNIRTNLSAYGILLSYAELVLLLGRHPKLSTNIEMLKRVSCNFLKFLAWYSSLLLAFSLSFYILFRNSSSSKTEDGDGEENFFLNPGMSMLKTVVMMTGEFDASSLPFESLPGTSQFMFILFVFLIALVLLNLLNGLAVSDTQAIKNDAEIVSLVSRVQLIHHFESMMLGNPLSWLSPLCHYCCCIPDERYLGFISGISRKMFHRMSIFPRMTPDFKAYVLPNQDCHVTFLSLVDRQAQQVKDITEVSVGKLDPAIVKSTVALLSRASKTLENDCFRQIMVQNQRLQEQNKQMMQDFHYFMDECKKMLLEHQQTMFENINSSLGNRRLMVESQRMIDVDN